ncbi:MAG: hypothetical protein IKV54_03190 [Clostridia bacterium]|nr:hypothetical protein [Clostridia bacterium]
MKKFLNRLFILLLAFSSVIQFSACSTPPQDTASDTTDSDTTAAADVTDATDDSSDGFSSLDGKKVIFIGNSFVYYGQTVIERDWSVNDQQNRINDKGYFYQLCKANGENVSVTNWTFGSHSLQNFCQHPCANKNCKPYGSDHLGHLTDNYYDYVIISGGRKSTTTEEAFLGSMETLMEFFRKANPDVKFVYLCCSGSHNISVSPSLPVNVLNNLKTIEEWGVTVVDWGKLIADIINGEVAVPGGVQPYTKNSFIVSNSESDGYHPNQLTGYITSLMTYCAITGKSAVGQPYEFCSDRSLNAVFDFDSYISSHYVYDRSTNYPEIFSSSPDMEGLQSLADKYLADKAFRNYNFEPLDND